MRLRWNVTDRARCLGVRSPPALRGRDAAPKIEPRHHTRRKYEPLLYTMARSNRRRHPPGLYWAPGTLHGMPALMAIAPDGEMTLRTVDQKDPESEGEAVGQLDGWLRDRGFTRADDAPLLWLV